MLAQYPTTLEQDLKLYKDIQSLPWFQKFALYLRVSEKKILLTQVAMLQVFGKEI